ncbi:hypothetical protein [Streptomyces carminius]|uniref:hypothetical protein n=1 Tax=Streptomyces carminius TaxID=2665496 RepID=UPI001304310C|nr:hypothetical protein [Streptomyces carminius]
MALEYSTGLFEYVAVEAWAGGIWLSGGVVQAPLVLAVWSADECGPELRRP